MAAILSRGDVLRNVFVSYTVHLLTLVWQGYVSSGRKTAITSLFYMIDNMPLNELTRPRVRISRTLYLTYWSFYQTSWICPWASKIINREGNFLSISQQLSEKFSFKHCAWQQRWAQQQNQTIPRWLHNFAEEKFCSTSVCSSLNTFSIYDIIVCMHHFNKARYLNQPWMMYSKNKIQWYLNKRILIFKNMY